VLLLLTILLLQAGLVVEVILVAVAGLEDLELVHLYP
jgi:hypothetical protein